MNADFSNTSLTVSSDYCSLDSKNTYNPSNDLTFSWT